MKLDQLKQALKFARAMEAKHEREANRLEKCVDCVTAKTYFMCPEDCPYLVKK